MRKRYACCEKCERKSVLNSEGWPIRNPQIWTQVALSKFGTRYDRDRIAWWHKNCLATIKRWRRVKGGVKAVMK